MLNKKKYNLKSPIFCINKKAHYHYFIEEVFQSGLVLKGWEIKSIRSGKINISESYVNKFSHEIYLCNSIIQPLKTASNNFVFDSTRKRKLLLHKNEISYLSIKINEIGYTLIPLSLSWKKSWCKLNFGLARGKNKIDKREEDKKNSWKKDKLRILKKTKIMC
ncbi:SsrA-binding protein SmpB [Buchnera aphidicola]|uniref:SsrA-binding protein n=1 Tax=Buchnera aphidicola (Aphis gossypii) TaxID=98785 RepID=A0A5J6ZAN2_9GAMM|nr:SsrA-binding protein SmpB [Buchnera aphidicola]QFQ32380.1 SsrA-binding protein SmpB [Buchnera aphidicola (Aphis gossypii)]UPT14617.1 SsrA-binding protein SmpB [Buchnera aphidicola (Aphis gossypii)]